MLNAFYPELSVALAEQLEAASTRDDVRVVVVTGSGPAFSAGADISGEDAHERFDVRALDAANRIVRAVVGCPKPVVAAVNGVAAGVGCSTALACDLVVAAESASFLLAFALIGLMPDGGTSATVAAAVGRPRAMRMALLGEAADRPRGPRRRAGQPHQQRRGVRRRGRPAWSPGCSPARRSARPPPRRAVNAATLPQLDAALERERTGQTGLLRTDDVAEGMRAFAERRRPQFRGR